MEHRHLCGKTNRLLCRGSRVWFHGMHQCFLKVYAYSSINNQLFRTWQSTLSRRSFPCWVLTFPITTAMDVQIFWLARSYLRMTVHTLGGGGRMAFAPFENWYSAISRWNNFRRPWAPRCKLRLQSGILIKWWWWWWLFEVSLKADCTIRLYIFFQRR